MAEFWEGLKHAFSTKMAEFTTNFEVQFTPLYHVTDFDTIFGIASSVFWFFLGLHHEINF